MERLKFLLFLLLSVSCCVTIDAAPPATPTGCKPLYGVSYDPFSTSTADICLPTEQVAIDVEIMSTYAKSIRIYSIAVCPETTKTILAESRKHNMTVLLGILINTSGDDIDAELDLLPDIMTSYSDVVQAVVVGNQALSGPKIGSKSRYAKRQNNVELLSGYMSRVRTILRRKGWKHPVTTSETWIVWESENGYPLSQAADFLCLNLNPYYEGFEVECLLRSKGKCTTAADYVNAKAEGLAEYYGMDVWVCETSWPTDGSSCCDGLQAYQQEGFKAKASPSFARKFLDGFVQGAGKTPYYIATAFDKDWRRVWAPCGHCSEKNLALSSFPNGVCDLCEEEYKLGIFDQYREKTERFDLPSVKCKLPSLPEIRLFVEEDPKEETTNTETSVKASGNKKKTKDGGEKTVVRTSTTVKTTEPVKKKKGSSTTTGEKTESTSTETFAKTKVSKSSSSAKAKSVVSSSTSTSTTTAEAGSKSKKRN